jgi:hypothetical protein
LWVGWAVAATLSLLIVLPTVKVFAGSYGAGASRPDMSFFAWMSTALPTSSYPVDSLQLAQLFRPDLTPATDLSQHFEAYLGGRYLGPAALVLAVVGLAAAPRRAAPWAAIATTGVLLALGNALWWNDKLLDPVVVLPLAVINKALAWVAEPLNFPVRYLAITSTAFAVLGGLASRWRWTILLVPLALADVAYNDPVPFPRSTFALEGRDDLSAPPGAVAELSWAPRADTIAEKQDPLTIFDETLRKRSTAAQLFLDRPFQTIAIERVDHWAFDGIVWTAASPLARALAGTPVEPAYLRAGVALLRARGFGSVLLTHACGGERDLVSVHTLTDLLGPPQEGACADLWALPDLTYGADELAKWHDRQAADVALVPTPNLGALQETTRPAVQPVPPPPGTEPPAPGGH